MSRQSKTAFKTLSPQTATFQRRYDEMDKRRSELIERLSALRSSSQNYPGYRRVLKLTNGVFRKSPVAQRLAVLQAAAWLIDILERL